MKKNYFFLKIQRRLEVFLEINRRRKIQNCPKQSFVITKNKYFFPQNTEKQLYISQAKCFSIAVVNKMKMIFHRFGLNFQTVHINTYIYTNTVHIYYVIMLYYVI